MVTTLLALAMGSAAQAQDTDVSAGNLQFLVGAGTMPLSGDPATFILGIRGELPVATSALVGVGVVLPLELATSGDGRFGMDAQNTAFELAPSVRGRILPRSVVRFYGDLGFGIVHRFSRTDSWFGSGEGSRTTGMTRSALGMEIGGREPGRLSLVLEPIGYRHYGGFGRDSANRFVMMAGLQVPL